MMYDHIFGCQGKWAYFERDGKLFVGWKYETESADIYIAEVEVCLANPSAGITKKDIQKAKQVAFIY